jgi:hypothetical protein
MLLKCYDPTRGCESYFKMECRIIQMAIHCVRMVCDYWYLNFTISTPWKSILKWGFFLTHWLFGRSVYIYGVRFGTTHRQIKKNGKKKNDKSEQNPLFLFLFFKNHQFILSWWIGVTYISLSFSKVDWFLILQRLIDSNVALNAAKLFF